MQKRTKLRIALQKKGRLHNDSMKLLAECGLKIHYAKDALYCHVENFPIDVLFVRDDDIPTLVMDDICDVGIVGENVLLEKQLYWKKLHENHDDIREDIQIEKRLGFGLCRLSIAVPSNTSYRSINDLNGARIATSYPCMLHDYLMKKKVNAKILNLAGSVEIAPRLEMAEGICDLVSTGKTLEDNSLSEKECVMYSQAVLIKKQPDFPPGINETYLLLSRRIAGVLKAKDSKYIMLHSPKSALHKIEKLLPGCEGRTILPLDGHPDKVAVHVVSFEGIFWSTLEKLKEAGASSILVLPIEKMLD